MSPTTEWADSGNANAGVFGHFYGRKRSNIFTYVDFHVKKKVLFFFQKKKSTFFRFFFEIT